MTVHRLNGDSAVEFVILVDVAPELAAPVDVATIERAVVAALQTVAQEEILPTQTQQTVSVRVTTDEEIRQLNQQYRGVDRATDVLSFSFLDEISVDSAAAGREVEPASWPVLQLPNDHPLELGDIILSQPYAARQAEELEHSETMELAWLTIHGTLQLLGYHHADEREATHMEALERRALARLGFSPD